MLLLMWLQLFDRQQPAVPAAVVVGQQKQKHQQHLALGHPAGVLPCAAHATGGARQQWQQQQLRPLPLLRLLQLHGRRVYTVT